MVFEGMEGVLIGGGLWEQSARWVEMLEWFELRLSLVWVY